MTRLLISPAPSSASGVVRLARYFPILEWGRSYNGTVFTGDLVAAVIVTIMLIPQSLAYALLAAFHPRRTLLVDRAADRHAIFGTSALLPCSVAVIS